MQRLINYLCVRFARWRTINYPGSVAWLVQKELQFGGIHTNVIRRKVSDLDPRSPEEIAKGGMVGGDRMRHHGYAINYAKYLNYFLSPKRSERVVICEVGILRGTGLAIWCDLFANGRVIGLDIDLSHTEENMEFLRSRGAFKKVEPELYLFDQLKPDNIMLQKLFTSEKIAVCIDDGLHTDEAILKTFDSLQPFFSEDFVYFIEDSQTAGDALRTLYPDYNIDTFGELTVVKPPSVDVCVT